MPSKIHVDFLVFQKIYIAARLGEPVTNWGPVLRPIRKHNVEERASVHLLATQRCWSHRYLAFLVAFALVVLLSFVCKTAHNNT